MKQLSIIDTFSVKPFRILKILLSKKWDEINGILFHGFKREIHITNSDFSQCSQNAIILINIVSSKKFINNELFPIIDFKQLLANLTIFKIINDKKYSE